MRKFTTAQLAAAVICLGTAGALPPAWAQDRGEGMTKPVVLPPFDATAAACTPPPGLDKVLAFDSDNDRDFMKGIGRGLEIAAQETGLAFQKASADNDPAAMAAVLDGHLAAHVGAVVAAPIDAAALAPHSKALIWSGAYLGTIVAPPATTILNAPQYLTGKTLGDAAADYINRHLGGRANVVILTHDSLGFLAPRFAAIRAALDKVPGAVIVADISPETVNNAGGYATMQTILLAEPRIDVVLGADTVVMGALAAMRDAGLARPDQFFGGIDGEADAVSELRRPNSPYKASISLAASVFGYAMGRHAADWLAGRSIPQAIDILPIALTAESLPRYEADIADPAAVYADPARRDTYLRFYGNICYDSRANFLNFPWSSEGQ